MNLPLIAFNDSQASISIQFDPASLLIQSITEVNTGPEGVVTYTLKDFSDQLIRSGFIDVATGTKVVDVSGQGLHMIQSTDKLGHTVYGPPFKYQASWG